MENVSSSNQLFKLLTVNETGVDCKYELTASSEGTKIVMLGVSITDFFTYEFIIFANFAACRFFAVSTNGLTSTKIQDMNKLIVESNIWSKIYSFFLTSRRIKG